MRTLFPQEISQIDQRLASLKIYYLEIYHELRDHYFTELEKKSAEEFEATLQQLNETFAWSVVKRMEKDLRKATNQQVSSMQWEVLRRWKLHAIDLIVFSCCAIGYLISYWFFGVDGIILFVGTMALLGFMIVLRNQRSDHSWSLKISRQKPVQSIRATILTRLGLFYSVLSWFYLGINLLSTSEQGEVRAIILVISSIFVFFYILTLVKIATCPKAVAFKNLTL